MDNNTIQHLALLPLPMTFFPSLPIQLNIFEDRYKEMVKDCMNEDKNFGVVLIREGKMASWPVAKPHKVGILAKITRVAALGTRRILVEAFGMERFYIRELNYDKSYLRSTVKVENAALANDRENRYAQELLPLLQEYMHLVEHDALEQIDFAALPRDARSLSYLAVCFLQIPQTRKQEVLEIKKTGEVVSRVIALYKRQIRLLDFLRSKTKAKQCLLN